MTTPDPLRALVVEGIDVARRVLEQVLQSSFTRPVVIDLLKGPEQVPEDTKGWDLLLVDIDHDTEAACAVLRRADARAWRLATTLYDDEDRLLPALRSGVHGYLLKQDRLERQIEILQRTVMGMPEITPAMARCLLQEARSQGQDDHDMRRALSALGRGASVRETAREIGRTAAQVEALLVHVYRSIGRPSPNGLQL